MVCVAYCDLRCFTCVVELVVGCFAQICFVLVYLRFSLPGFGSGLWVGLLTLSFPGF